MRSVLWLIEVCEFFLYFVILDLNFVVMFSIMSDKNKCNLSDIFLLYFDVVIKKIWEGLLNNLIFNNFVMEGVL